MLREERRETMNILSPSILAADFTILGEQLRAVSRAGAGYIHIDVMDGVFVPSISYGMPVIRSIRKATDKVFDVHLMIENPKRYIGKFADCGADIITFHLEATDRVAEVVDEIHGRGLKAGLAIKPETPVEAFRPYLDMADMFLVMTVEPGFGGQAYMEACTEKIRAARKMVKESGRNIDIQVDGGINRENIEAVLDAGANVIALGSAIFEGDIEDNVQYFLNILSR